MARTRTPPQPPRCLDLDTRPLAELAARRVFWRGEEIGAQDQPCGSLYLIADGQVLLSRRSPRGEDYALYLLGAGELFGEGSLTRARQWLVTARAVTDGSAYVLPAAQFPRFARYYPQLTTQVVTLLSARLERAHRRLDVVTADTARERVLGLLRVMAEHHGEARGAEVWLPMRLTQAELGNMVGLARETVVRSLAELEASGLLRKEGRRGFWLLQSPAPDATTAEPSPRPEPDALE